MERPPIYFLHIPKTAGTSLANLIRGAYGVGQAIPAYDLKDLCQLSREQINEYRCYTGHFGTALFSMLDHDIPTVTVLRDPFERVISDIFYTEKYHAKDPSVPLQVKHGRTLWEKKIPFLSKGIEKKIFKHWLRDLQTRTLGINLDFTAYASSKKNTVVHCTQLLLAEDLKWSMDEILERAKSRLDKCVVVGTVEKFDQSVGLICDYIGIPHPDVTPNLNKAKLADGFTSYRSSDLISQDFKDYIDSITTYDQILYKYASQLLDARLANAKSATISK